MEHGTPAGSVGVDESGHGADYWTSVRSDPLLIATASALLVLDRRLRIRAANPEYLRLTEHRLDELLGRELIDVYPAVTATSMLRSARRVLRWGTRHRVRTEQQGPPTGDGHAGVTLCAVHSPLCRDGALLGVLHQVDRVRPAEQRAPRQVAERTVVNQAIGMLMGWHGCSPEDAFAALRTFAANHDVPLRTVAGAVVREGCVPVGRDALTDLDWLLAGITHRMTGDQLTR